MTVEIVTAVYEKGMLRPLQPLNLRERQAVRIQVLPEGPDVSEEPGDSIDVLIQRLVAKGLMRPRPRGPIPPDPVSEEERLRLADLMGSAPSRPLSEIIVEDRGEW
jgi:predicted DNA-binding antitoxin AbrB/MazE fold protein